MTTANSVIAATTDVVNAFRSMIVVMGIMTTVILLIVYDYMRKLESTGCACSKDWRRTYITWYLAIAIIYNVIKLLTSVFGGIDMLVKVMLWGVVPLALFVMSVLFVIFSVQYVNRLKKEKCACSEGTGRTVLQIVTWYKIIMWVAQFVTLLNLMGLLVVISANVGKVFGKRK